MFSIKDNRAARFPCQRLMMKMTKNFEFRQKKKFQFFSPKYITKIAKWDQKILLKYNW